MRFGVKAVIIVVTLALSCIAGLAVANAQTRTAVYLPLMMVIRSKIGIAPGGYITGDLDYLGASWTYRWGNAWYTDTVPEWVDMVYSSNYINVPIRSNIILGANEPDRIDQANMTATQLAIMQHDLETMYPDKQLISPACSDGHPDCVWDAAAEYERLYGQRPRWNGIALHYYRRSESMLPVSEYVRWFRGQELAHGYDVPLWLTEVGVCGVDEVATFQDVMRAADEYDYLARVAWYKLRVDDYDSRTCSTMIDERGGLTPLGEAYQNRAGDAWR